MTGSPDCRRIIGIGFRVYRMPAVEELCQCTTTILTPNFVQRLFVFHRTQCRTLQQHIEVEVLPLQAGIQAELQPRSLVKGKRMFVLTVNLAVTIPVFILIITRQDVAFLEAVVIPNIVPTGVTTGGSITKLYPLITVRQVVVAPAIIRVGPRSFFRSSQVFLTGNGSNTLQVIAYFTNLITVGQLQFHTELAVAVQVFTRSSGTYHGRQGTGTASETAGTQTVEVVERNTQQAVPSFKVETDVECLRFEPSDVLVRQCHRTGCTDKLAAENVARRITVVVAVGHVAAGRRVGVPHSPVIIQVAIVT